MSGPKTLKELHADVLADVIESVKRSLSQLDHAERELHQLYQQVQLRKTQIDLLQPADRKNLLDNVARSEASILEQLSKVAELRKEVLSDCARYGISH
jgi:conjugal transfer/entry exclusion protein